MKQPTMKQPTSKPRRWWPFSCFLLVVLLIPYGVSASREYPSGGSRIGLFFGILALGLLLFEILYGMRKRLYTYRLGALHRWLTAHTHLGLLLFVVVLLHTGFRFEDTLAVVALILMAIAVGTGVLGQYLYKILPPKFATIDRTCTEDDFLAKITQLAQEMERLAKGKSPAFQTICTELVRPQHVRLLSAWQLLWGGTRGPVLRESSIDDRLGPILAQVEAHEEQLLHLLCELAGQRRSLQAQLIRLQWYRDCLLPGSTFTSRSLFVCWLLSSGM